MLVSRRTFDERGSALILFPAGVLAVLVLAAIAMDLSLVHLARREAITVAESAANDATTYGLDEHLFRSGGGYALDPGRVRAAIDRSIVAAGVGEHLDGPPRVTIDGTTVRVQVALQVDYVFARALPGVAHTTTVTANAAATPVAR